MQETEERKAGLTLLDLARGIELANEAALIRALRDQFRDIQGMGAAELITTAQTLRTIAATDERFCDHPVLLSVANAVREKMVDMVEYVFSKKTFPFETTLARSFGSAFGAKEGWFGSKRRDIRHAITSF